MGLRYVRARSSRFFVSFITWASLIGVCVGVAALIVILSVMNGFEGELRDRLLSLGAPVRVTASAAVMAAGGAPSDGATPSAETPSAETPSTDEWRRIAQLVRSIPGVSEVSAYAELQALAVRQPDMLPVLLRGIDPGSVSGDLAHAITQGRLADLTAGSSRLLVGAVIAERLGLSPGDPVTVLVPTFGAGGVPAPKLREFTVAGVFEAGLPDNDATLMFANLADVRSLGLGTATEGLRVRLRDVFTAAAVAAQLRTRLPAGLDVSDWTQDNASYFRAIRIEKTMMSLILLLIVAVAAFNIVAMLVMVVTDKRTDIAIVRTFGASPRRVMGIFITQGLVIGWLGVAFGVALGLALAFNVDTIVPFLERTFRFQFMDSDVYYITAIPSEVHAANVVAIALAAFALTGLATVYPALCASRIAPAEALRYE